ncbi:MAG: ABC transporter ATP-binding protein [Chloroflexota bacterium]|nr:MAG: ABC transporter ATP-binding protein [Chloroflexota bacterium]
MEIEVKDLVQRFGGILALNHVSLKIESKQIVGLIGPNGSGKTTLVNIIGSVLQPTSGDIYLDGKRVTGLKPHEMVRKGVSRTFQVTRAFRRMTVMENMLVPALAVSPGHGRPALEKRAREVLDFLTMDHLRNDYARSLSGGQQKLLELGQLLMTDPQLLLLDEPFAGVHPRLMEKIFEYILEIHAQGKSFLIISHDMDSIFTLCQRLVVLSYGELIADGDPQVVKLDEAVIEAYLGEEVEDA